MDEDPLQVSKQRSIIRDSLKVALKKAQGESDVQADPFTSAIQTLKSEIELMEPFKDTEIFSSARKLYEQSVRLIEKTDGMVEKDEADSPEGENICGLIEYYGNLMKIHRIILSRTGDKCNLIPAAPSSLRTQVERTYNALGQLQQVLKTITQVPKAPVAKKPSGKSNRQLLKRRQEEVDDPLEVEYRISPFITEGPRKGTVDIDGITWPRYV